MKILKSTQKKGKDSSLVSDSPLFQRAFLPAAQFVVEIVAFEQTLFRDGDSLNSGNRALSDETVFHLGEKVEQGENHRLDTKGHHEVEFDGIGEFILVVKKRIDFISAAS